jgi:hypothetical protein
MERNALCSSGVVSSTSNPLKSSSRALPMRLARRLRFSRQLQREAIFSGERDLPILRLISTNGPIRRDCSRRRSHGISRRGIHGCSVNFAKSLALVGQSRAQREGRHVRYARDRDLSCETIHRRIDCQVESETDRVGRPDGADIASRPGDGACALAARVAPGEQTRRQSSLCFSTRPLHFANSCSLTGKVGEDGSIKPLASA